SYSDRQLAAGSGHAGPASDCRWNGASPCARGPAAERRRPQTDPSGQGRADLFGDADEHEPRHADDGVVAGGPDHPWCRRVRSGPQPFESTQSARRCARTRRFSSRTPARSQRVARRAATRRGAPRRRELVMDDQSLWKKELSFGRKPEDEKDAGESPPNDEKPTSMWKKELSLKREEKADAVEGDAAANATVDEPAVDEPVVAERTEAEPAAEQEETWTKEASFSRTPEPEPDAVPEPIVAEESVSSEDETWKKEVSFSRKPAADPLSKQAADDAFVAGEETVADEQAFADEPVAAQEDVATELDTEEPLPSLEIEAEPWAAPPSLPPASLPEAPVAIVPAPIPPVDVAAPVAAVELPLPSDDTTKVPFWKKELSLGSNKRDKPEKPAKPAKERKQKAPKVKAERAPKTDEPKEPKQPKERKQKAPKVKVERGSSKGRIVGLKIGASQLAAARVSNNGSAELLQVAREPLAPGIVVGGELRDPEALAEALKDFFTKHGLPKKGVRLGLANNRIGVRTFEIAGIEDQKQLANAIRFRAQE